MSMLDSDHFTHPVSKKMFGAFWGEQTFIESHDGLLMDAFLSRGIAGLGLLLHKGNLPHCAVTQLL